VAPAQGPGLAAADTGAGSRWYAALLARDARFDGRFFVGVTSTGVYCRPVCRVRPPLLRNCRFFGHAAQAEAAGFRPCLRCRPELAPGLSLVDSPRELAAQAARLIDDAARRGDDLPMPRLAARLGVTDRHLRRIFVQAWGVAPLAYLRTRRLLQAKHLLTDTDLPVTEVALASGFGSLRRFHAAFADHYRLQPGDLRRQRNQGSSGGPGEPVTLTLGYRPPYDAAGMRRFWAARALPGIETVSGQGDAFELTRSWRIAVDGRELTGWTRARLDGAAAALTLDVSRGLSPALGALMQRHRQALDLDAEPARIDPVIDRLGLAPCPGLRLPGAFDGWETAVRIVLGQQVSVAAARTLTRRLVDALGVPLPSEPGLPSSLTRTFPTATAVASASPDTLGALGIVRQRVTALQSLARAVLQGTVRLEPTAPLQPTMDALQALPGIGPWTAQLVALRVLSWPDAFPASDIGLLNAMGTRRPAEAEALAEAWRPWRAYAVIRWWQTLETADD
jgi:AraC family transcriptional regulator of adaptative response / DNA-3-methyladenine glycosylase II